MLDCYKRDINYLRISVTDKCNLRCTYCMPEEGIQHREHKDFLSFETIVKVVEAAVGIGIYKFRLTGGEPLVKKGIVDLIRMIALVEGVEELAMTTNAILLPKYAKSLKDAGLSSVNISLDTLNAGKYAKITRGGEINTVLKGIEAAVKAKLPVKINMVIQDNNDVNEIDEMNAFCLDKGIKLQLINHYTLSSNKKNNYTFDRPPKCSVCNRIRLLADGTLKPCLHTDNEIKLDLNNPIESLKKTILKKPERGSACSNRNMMEIGG